VLTVGVLFVGYGSIALLVSIPHAALVPILLSLAAIIGGVGAIFGVPWSRYFLYVVSAACATVWVSSLVGLRTTGLFNGPLSEIGFTILPGAIVVAILVLSCIVVRYYFRRRAGDT
jgi:hypothetical protein